MPADPGGGAPLADTRVRTASTASATFGTRAGKPPLTSSGIDHSTQIKNLQQLVQLRWLAVFGQLFTILVVHFGFGITIPIEQLLFVVWLLVLFNVLSMLRLKAPIRVTNGELLAALLVDVAALTAELHLVGGAANPFVFLYLLQVMLAAVLLPRWGAWIVVLITGLCVGGLARLAHPLPLPNDPRDGLSNPYVAAVLVCFGLIAALVVFFIVRIEANLRERDQLLIQAQRRVLEQDHIVRMGLLATGAAHELGTPLSTLAVILGDWRHLSQIQADADLIQDVTDMQEQVARCKSIVTGILHSAGEARGESSRRTTVCVFLDEVVADWRQRRPDNRLVYDNRFGADLPMVSDSALKQMMGNVLDNAHEASPHIVWLSAERSGDDLVLAVRDQGPGFAPQVLERLGTPYQSTKGQPGRGLGLFLVRNVVHNLGGTLEARNLTQGGALVQITLPLAAIALDAHDAPHES
ncbi:histidine kinase [Comamonas serinivorans]|uniref:histidine kinase n=1 Tax=Comamonas serinivorans TaxID=1082851 RepID=A0A1Y0EP97_9BURK|nr:ATP-binding protein [Comamonas serinivorans]ARU05112.1 histidine kinase [Comamonas serinivorans]